MFLGGVLRYSKVSLFKGALKGALFSWLLGCALISKGASTSSSGI